MSSTYTYQWQRTPDGGVTITDIPGASGSFVNTPPFTQAESYLLQSADLGDEVRMRVTDGAGGLWYSPWSSVVAAGGGGGYSADRWVYAIGDPTNTTWHSSGDPGWGWPDVHGNGQISTAFHNRRAASGNSSDNASYIDSRVNWDTSGIPVMQSVSGYLGDGAGLGSLGACPTVAMTINPSDPLGDSANGQASYLRLDSSNWIPAMVAAGWPDPRPHQNQEVWYSAAVNTSPGFEPQPVDTFNALGMEFHRSIGSGSSIGTYLAPIAPGVGSRFTTGMMNGGYYWYYPTTTSPLAVPKRCIILLGGNIAAGADAEDANHTARTLMGPDFIANQRLIDILRITWSAYKSTQSDYSGQIVGSLDWWCNNGDGRGYVQYASMSDICTMNRNGSTPDSGVYPELQFYRRMWSAAPRTMTAYVGGWIRGSTYNDVAIA